MKYTAQSGFALRCVLIWLTDCGISRTFLQVICSEDRSEKKRFRLGRSEAACHNRVDDGTADNKIVSHCCGKNIRGLHVALGSQGQRFRFLQPETFRGRSGHESIHVTYRYAHLFPNTQQAMADQLNKLYIYLLEIQK